jgi:hypothetical protein
VSKPIRKALFQICSIPSGGAPDWVLEAWVGCVVEGYYDLFENPRAHDMLTGQPVEVFPDDVYVFEEHALEVLARSNPQAAQWWRDNGFPRSKGFLFRFRACEMERMSVCEVIPRTS